MADAPVVHIGENSREQVALKLMWEVIRLEKKTPLTRKELLDTYAECLQATEGNRAIAR